MEKSQVPLRFVLVFDKNVHSFVSSSITRSTVVGQALQDCPGVQAVSDLTYDDGIVLLITDTVNHYAAAVEIHINASKNKVKSDIIPCQAT